MAWVGRARLFAVPLPLFELPLKLLGRGDMWERLAGSLVVDPGKLMAAGWRPDADTLGALARMARSAFPLVLDCRGLDRRTAALARHALV